MNGPSIRSLLFATAMLAPAAASAQAIPADAKPTCTVASSVFAHWFTSGTPTANGVVEPANSVTFPNVPNCSFYQWSEQMFLWLNSPAPAAYGGGARIFDSAAFFDVSPEDGAGARHFIAHSPGFIRPFPVRVAQAGPHGQPVIFSKAGQLLEIQAPVAQGVTPNLAPNLPAGPATRVAPNFSVRTQAGALTAVSRAEIGPNRQLRLFDTAGALIAHAPAPVPAGAALRQIQPVSRLIINNIPVFLNSQGQVVDVEQGQAETNGVLETQNGSLIYYATMVNDVYAYFATGTDDNAISPKPTQFPTTQADLNKIIAFASAHGKTFPDPNALAIEVKTSWVEASTLPGTTNFITMTATIPTYDKSNPAQWTPNGEKTALLAMVGMHVVGSAAGHPEMIWATFEHDNNAPLGTYTYNPASGPVKTVTQNTAGSWLFAATNAAAPFNQEHMMASGADIVPVAPFAIGPSNVLRAKAWGAASNLAPNPLENTTASNTEILSINNSVLGQLPPGDIRKNYMLAGATWTINGLPPTANNQVGTSQLGGSTLETFQLGGTPSTTSGSVNCFSCHVTNNVSVSHVFQALKPLF